MSCKWSCLCPVTPDPETTPKAAWLILIGAAQWPKILFSDLCKMFSSIKFPQSASSGAMLFGAIDPQSSYQTLMSCCTIKNSILWPFCNLYKYCTVRVQIKIITICPDRLMGPSGNIAFVWALNLSSIVLWYLTLHIITHYPRHSWSVCAVPLGCFGMPCQRSENWLL